MALNRYSLFINFKFIHFNSLINRLQTNYLFYFLSQTIILFAFAQLIITFFNFLIVFNHLLIFQFQVSLLNQKVTFIQLQFPLPIFFYYKPNQYPKGHLQIQTAASYSHFIFDLQYRMIFDPLQKDQTQGRNTNSKSKTGVNTLIPLTIKQTHTLIGRKFDFAVLGKIVIIGLVVKIKQMVNRTQATISDGTGSIIVIEGQRGSELQQQHYFKFVVTVKEDKDEMILYSLGFQRVTDFNQISYHHTAIMEITYKNLDLQI